MSDATKPVAPPSLTPRVIEPTKFRVELSELWTTRRVARMIGVRDMKAKYKQAALGPLWLVLAPLGLLGALAISFSGVASVNTYGIPYVVFALCGLSVWTFVQLSLTLATLAIAGNADLVRRSPMPRVALLTGSMIGNLPPFGVMLSATLVGALIAGLVSVKWLLLPVLVLWLLLFTLALVLAIASISARFRDTVAAMPLVIQAGVFVAPVGYGLAGAPKNIHTLLTLNPVSGLIEAWRWALLDMPNAQISAIGISLGFTAVLLVLGWRIFGRMEVTFADYV
jgi:lipopolysaccharide transport system permease protein